MGGIIEEYAKERGKKAAKDRDREIVRRMIRLGTNTIEQISEVFPEFTLDEIRQIEAEEMAMA